MTIDDAILTALRAHTTLALAYTDADGPQACAVQGRGLVRRLPDAGPERAAAWAAYAERFPFVTHDERLGAALAATALWELRPGWLRLIDNARGFGLKTEWSAERPG